VDMRYAGLVALAAAAAVVLEGMTWEYPWAGSHSLELALPLVEGAAGRGEGWSVVPYLAGN